MSSVTSLLIGLLHEILKFETETVGLKNRAPHNALQ